MRVIGTHTTILTGQADLTSPLTVSADTSYSRLSSHSNTTSDLTASATIFSSQCSSMTYPAFDNPPCNSLYYYLVTFGAVLFVTCCGSFKITLAQSNHRDKVTISFVDHAPLSSVLT